MRKTHCGTCQTAYSDLQRAGHEKLTVCNNCHAECCPNCIIEERISSQLCALRCPVCFSYSLKEIELADRFSIYAHVDQLIGPKNVIALLFVPWSVYPMRNETIINECIPLLAEFAPSFFLLNEDHMPTRQRVASWLPKACDVDVPSGNGTIIWLHEGQPISFLIGGPHMAKLEILKYSRESWIQQLTS